MARNKFDIDEKLEAEFNMSHLKRLLGYIKKYRMKMAFAAALMIISGIAGLLEPIIIKDAIDVKIKNGNIQGLVILAIAVVIILITRALCIKWGILTMTEVGQNVVADIRHDLFCHIQKLPFSFFDSRPHGKIIVRVVNYVNALSNLLSNGFINLLTDLFSLLFIVVFMFFIDFKLTLICLAGLPVLFAGIFFIKNLQRKTWQDVSRKQSNMNAYVHESIEGMKITQSYVREDVNLQILDDLSMTYKLSWLKAIKVQKLLQPMVENISILVIAAVFLIGVSMIGKGVTIGVLVAFVSYMGRFWGPITNLANFYNQIIVAMAYLERIFETMDEKIIVDDIPGAASMPGIRGNVEFRNVDFGYEEGIRILKNVSFYVKEGDTIALVGPTGAGKTTVVNLLSRFYNINGGRIFIDGNDISLVRLHTLRKQMGVMMQDAFIFSGTIMENIRYGKLDASDEDVVNAAKAVKADDFIKKMKDGYLTEVNERGSRLSAGQKQLISFARALLADPKILILDEATSSIDTETERAIQEGLERLLAGRTSFIIAHRLSTIKNASRIMYIADGCIIEQGSHEELIGKKGAYWQLYNSQSEMLKAI